MSSTGIFTICIAAFVLIFLLLSVLSIMMRGLTFLFPPPGYDDSAAIAAIMTAYQSVYPGKKISNIREIKK